MQKRKQTGIFSEARFRVLRTLYFDKDGVSLREISHRSNVSLHGVQVATQSLLRLGLISKRREKERVIFKIVENHFEYKAIEAMIRALVMADMRKQAEDDSIANRNTLSALDDLREFSARIQKGTSETRKSL